MYTLSSELNDYFTQNHIEFVPEEWNKLPVIKAIDGLIMTKLIRKNYNTSLTSDYVVYYGKNPIIVASERTDNTNLSHSQEYYCPVGMIFDIEQLLHDQRVKNIYPFDPVKSNISTEENPLEVYQLENSTLSIDQYIMYFFGSNSNYQSGENTTVNKPLSEISDLIFAIHQNNSASETDLTISMILKQPFNFLQYAKCIVLPDKLMAIKTFRQLIAENTHICIKTYPIRRGRRPAIYNETVERLCEDFINGCGRCYLKEQKLKEAHTVSPDSSITCCKDKGVCSYYGCNL